MKTILLSSFFTALLLLSCAPPSPEDYESDEALFQRAQVLYGKKQYTSASEHFEALINKFPQSLHLADASYLLADSHLQMREFVEAEFDFQSFLKRYPSHPKVPQALLSLGKTHESRARKAPERDQTHTKSALYHYTQLIQQHPSSEAATEAQSRAKKLRKRLVGKNLYVAKFYFKRKEFAAAIPRLLEIYGNDEFEDLQQEAAYLLAKAYVKLERPEDAQKYVETVLKQEDHGYKRKTKALNTDPNP